MSELIEWFIEWPDRIYADIISTPLGTWLVIATMGVLMGGLAWGDKKAREKRRSEDWAKEQARLKTQEVNAASQHVGISERPAPFREER